MKWSLYDKSGKYLEPLKFSNGKTQEDVVNEVLEAIKEDHKIIFIKGICGSGKSAIALNIAKEVGRTSIVVPVKYLQSQYAEDYTNKMYILDSKGEKLGITNLMGRNNFDCIYNKNCKADDKFLPCSIEIKKDNWDLIRAFLKDNPTLDPDDFKDIEDVRRLHVGAVCPYWSPVMSKEFGDYGLDDARKFRYKAVKGKEYVYHQREPGCKYYEQYKAYVDADVLIFNSAKYEIENVMNRKPLTEVEIIDECDEFLDNLGNERRINLDFMQKKLKEVAQVCKEEDVKKLIVEIYDLVEGISKSKWMEEFVETEDVVKIDETKVIDLFRILLKNEYIAEYEDLEQYYATAKSFEGMLDDTYVSFYRNQKGYLILRAVNINLSKKLGELIDKNKVFVMMSGTLHSNKVLKDIFGIENFITIDAETKHRGIIRKYFTGFEKNYRYKEFKEGRVTRKDFLESLNVCIEKAEKPFLVHVKSFADLPTNKEKDEHGVTIMSRERLMELQEKYKQGELLQMFKEGKIDVLYSTRCNRGVDLPGDICKSIIFTRYPFPAMDDIFWKVLKKKDSKAFQEFYFDKSRREFLQRIYRGLRSDDDAVNMLSPDIMVMKRGF